MEGGADTLRLGAEVLDGADTFGLELLGSMDAITPGSHQVDNAI